MEKWDCTSLMGAAMAMGDVVGALRLVKDCTSLMGAAGMVLLWNRF